MTVTTNTLLLILFAVSAGAVIPLQAGANAHLAGIVGHPL